MTKLNVLGLADVIHSSEFETPHTPGAEGALTGWTEQKRDAETQAETA